MKTIDEAAYIHSTDENTRYRWQPIKMDSFIKGAEFAQRWISVEEELPENKDHGFSDLVLTKNSFGNILLERYDFEFNHFNAIRYDAIQTGDGQVTHWRPIELK